MGTTMRALRLRGEGDLALEQLETPQPGADEALVAVHAAGLTRDELTWPVDRLPATPSYELSGTVVETGSGADGVAAGSEVFGLTPFDRDGVAADYALVPVDVLAAKPHSLSHVEAAALPLAGLSAWQGLFVHGGLEAGERVAILGASGGVGHLAVQLAAIRGAHVIRDRPVDLLFDTAGAEALDAARRTLGEIGRIVSVVEEPPDGTYFVVESDRRQLAELARLVDDGSLRPSVDSVYELTDAEAAFQRLAQRGKRGKVVLTIAAH
jgi:NADPH:quinone reductase-like Zn-dependent oxidoreductase